jgi:hypothetical protein
MAKYRPLQPVRYFFEPITPAVDRLDRPAAYLCDECKTVTRYEKYPVDGPGSCACGASPASLLPLKPSDLDDFRFPSDLGGDWIEYQGERFPVCFGCIHYECWHREPTRTCGVGLGQSFYWSASERPMIRPALSVCFGGIDAR